MKKILSNYKTVESWYDPLNYLRSKVDFETEMSDDDLFFLCGLIKEHKPKKIVEVGVAEGGTTGVILESLNMLHSNATMYSVDLCKKFYKNSKLKTGYEYFDKLSALIDGKCKHRFLLGKRLPLRIDAIGNDIDFVILDTSHSLPGELLDLITLLPYLSENAVVVMHDVDLSRIGLLNGFPYKIYEHMVATKIAFLSVFGDKYINTNLCGLDGKNPANICAFNVNNETIKNSVNLFYALTIPWANILSEKEIEEYRNIFRQHYDDICMNIFESAVYYSEYYEDIWQ